MTTRFWFLLFLLLPIFEAAFSSYLRNLLRVGTTTTLQFPIRNGRPVDEDGDEITEVSFNSTAGPETTDGGIETTAGGRSGPPATGEPKGSTAPPQPSSPVPLSTRPPGTTGVLGSTTTIASTTTGCSVGVWSEWREEMKCNAECGACGTVVRRRTCTTAAAGCPCEGDFRSSRPCRISACPYPQPSCCPPFTLIFVNGTFACGPQNEVVMAEYLAELSSRASSTTPLIATRPHRTSPSAGNGTTTTAATRTEAPVPTLIPTGGPGPNPTGTPGPKPTGAPRTTEKPVASTSAPEERTTEDGEEETTATEEEDEVDPRPWYHRIKLMSKPMEGTPMWMQLHA